MSPPFIFVEFANRCASLAARTKATLHLAYNKKTWSAHKRMFLVFLAFCMCLEVDLQDNNAHGISMFMQFLFENKLKSKSAF